MGAGTWAVGLWRRPSCGGSFQPGEAREGAHACRGGGWRLRPGLESLRGLHCGMSANLPFRVFRAAPEARSRSWAPRASRLLLSRSGPHPRVGSRSACARPAASPQETAGEPRCSLPRSPGPRPPTSGSGPRARPTALRSVRSAPVPPLCDVSQAEPIRARGARPTSRVSALSA